MKINGKLMVAVVMMVGSLAATGCSTASADDTGVVAPEETPATAPVENTTSATAGVEKDSFGIRFFAPFAPRRCASRSAATPRATGTSGRPATTATTGAGTSGSPA